MNEPTNKRLMILFSAGTNLFACDTEHIIEVVPRVKLSIVPHTPNYFCGLMNYGGYPVPIVDFCQLVSIHPSKDSLHTRIILFSHPSGGEPLILGIVAEKITETILLKRSRFINSGVIVENLPFLAGVYSTENETIQYVEIEKLFEQMQQLQEIVGAQDA